MQNAIDVLWENFYDTKPLTLWEFVNEFKSLKPLFPCVTDALDRFDKASKDLVTYPSEIYVQGAMGIGKGIYCYILFLYRVYLFLHLKDPKKLIGWASTVDIGACIIGPKSDEVLKGVVNFIQSAESKIFCINHECESDSTAIVSKVVWAAEGVTQLEQWVEKELDGSYSFRARNGNKLVCKAIKTSAELLGIQPAISYFTESSDYELYSKLVSRVSARFGLQNKALFSTIIVDKYPNNLYSDLLDQTIKEKEKESNVLVERFVYYFYRDCKTDEDFYKEDHPYMIDPDTGKVERKDAKDVEGLNWICFPEKYRNIDLYEMAKENPETFIRDILGLPLTSPLSKEYKVTDELSALQTVRKLIRDYHIQVRFGEGEMYLEIPDVNTKIKVY